MRKLDGPGARLTNQAHRARRGESAARTAKTQATSQVHGDVHIDAPKPQSKRAPSTTIDLASLTAHIAAQAGTFVGHEAIAGVDVLHEQALPSHEPGRRHAMVSVDVKFAGGSHERFLMPLSVDAKGNVSDGLASADFKKAMMDVVAHGGDFVDAQRSSGSKGGGARRRPGVTQATTTTTTTAGRRAQSQATGALGAQLLKAAGDKSASKVLEGGAYDAHIEAAALSRAVYGESIAIERSKNPWAQLVEKGYTTRERYEHVVEQAKILSPENADALVVEFFKNVFHTLEKQPASVHAFHEALKTQPTFGPVFYGYAQFVGVPQGKSEATFDDLAKALDVIQGPSASLASTLRDGGARGLGFREVELLPFYSSPQKDGGYDISDHAQVDKARGGNEAYGRFMDEAVKRGMRVTADLVANHVSDEHGWVKALLKGDESMLSRFVVWDDAVKIGERVVDDKTFNVFLHQKGKDAGKISHVWQIFPDNNPDTFIEAKVNGDKHNVYASFMNPYQWDINGADPQVLSEYLRTIGLFANMGQMGTRMDAIIHMGKKPGTFNINNPESQAFMALTKAFASHVAPGNMFLPEANLDWDKAKADWLSPEKTFAGKVENTAGDALISFDVHRAIWDSLLKESKQAWTGAQSSLGELPAHKSLMVYLGLHDETLIEDPKLRKELLARGFHDFAGRGVGDSPAALLDGNADRLAMAHVLLYSSKGHPAVYYRTLVGSPNNDAYYDAKTQERLDAQKAAGETPSLAKSRDTRDLDRGPVTLEQFGKALADGYKPAVTVKALNALWDKNASVRTNDVTEVKNPDDGVVSFARKSAHDESAPLLQLINLTGKKKTVTLDAKDLAKQLGWTGDLKLRDLLAGEIAGKERSVACAVDGGTVKIELAPYEAMYLERA